MELMADAHGKKSPREIADRKNAAELPDHLSQMVRGYMPSRCILTALELDIFTVIGGGATAEQLASKINTNTRATEILLNALVALGLLSKSGAIYKNTPDSTRYFVHDSKDNQRDGLLHMANIWHRWSTLTDVVRSGSRIPLERSNTPEWTHSFIAAMQLNAKDRAPLLVKALGTNGVRRILDLGGGSGVYSIAFAKASANVQCEILDLPDVVPLTTHYVESAGVSAQVNIRAGNMLYDDFGSGHDIILLNAICHMFSEQQNQDLFLRARQALAPNGRLVVQDFILNSDKTGPQHAALFSINMLVGTDAGASYSEQEYVGWMRAAGFPEARRIALPGPSDLIVGKLK